MVHLLFSYRWIVVALLAFGLTQLCVHAFESLREESAIDRGKQLFEKQEWAKSIKEFDEAIKLNPESSAAFEWRGTAWLQLKEWDKAISDFDESIRLNPKLASAFSNRGVAWLKKAELEKAMEDFTSAIQLHPRYAPAYHNRGILWKNRGELDKAITDYSDAIRLNPRFEDAFVSRATAWVLKGVYDKSLKDFDAALALNPRSLEGLFGRARLRATCPDAAFRDGAKAVEDAKKGSELPGKRLSLHIEILAASHAENGDFQEAVKIMKQVLEDRDYMKSHGNDVYNRLKLYENMKSFRDAPLEKKLGK